MDSDDEELRLAIELSLQNGSGGSLGAKDDVVDLTEDDEIWPGFSDLDDMNFWKAIAVSMGEGNLSRSIILMR